MGGRADEQLQRVQIDVTVEGRAPLLRQGSKQHAALPGGNSGRQGVCEQAAQVANAPYASLGHWAPANPRQRSAALRTANARIKEQWFLKQGLSGCVRDRAGAVWAKRAEGLNVQLFVCDPAIVGDSGASAAVQDLYPAWDA